MERLRLCADVAVWLAQGAALIGLWGLTFLAVAVYASPAVLADDLADTARPWLAPAIAAAVLVALAGYGAIRLARTPTTYVDDVRLRLMQPNLPQDEKFNYGAEAVGDEALSRAVRPRQRPRIQRACATSRI